MPVLAWPGTLPYRRPGVGLRAAAGELKVMRVVGDKAADHDAVA